MPTWARGASSRRSNRGPTSSSARASPTPRSSSVRRPGISAGSATIGTAWPAPSSPGTWSSAARSAPAATTPSSRKCRASSIPGFPIAEMHDDGSSVITKHPGTGGLVSVGTVTAQLLYEIDKPAYVNPDVVARFDTIRLEQQGPDRVRISGVRGEPAPPNVKVCLNYLGGFRNQMTFVLTGLDIDEKAALVERTLRGALDVEPVRRVRDRPGAHRQARRRDESEASALLKVTVKSQDAKKVGRAFSGAIIEMALASYPGFFCTTPPTDASPFGVYWPTLVPADVPKHAVVLEDGTRIPIPPTEPTQGASPRRSRAAEAARRCRADRRRARAAGHAVRRPLGRQGRQRQRRRLGPRRPRLRLARIVPDRRASSRQLIPEAADLEVRRYELPNLKALNFVVVGLLGEGVASSTRFDPQAKSLGEYLRSRVVRCRCRSCRSSPAAPPLRSFGPGAFGFAFPRILTYQGTCVSVPLQTPLGSARNTFRHYAQLSRVCGGAGGRATRPARLSARFNSMPRHRCSRSTGNSGHFFRHPELAGSADLPRTRRLRIEPLESRTLLTAVSWDGGGDGVNWTDPVNWSGNLVPVSADDVVIDVPGTISVTMASGTPTIRSLTCRREPDHFRRDADGHHGRVGRQRQFYHDGWDSGCQWGDGHVHGQWSHFVGRCQPVGYGWGRSLTAKRNELYRRGTYYLDSGCQCGKHRRSVGRDGDHGSNRLD